MDILKATQVIAFNRSLVEITGSIKSALLLSQMLYWTRTVGHRWIYKTRKEWNEETGLSRFEQENSRSILRERGFIKEKKMGVLNKVHFKLNLKKLNSAWQVSWSETSQLVGQKLANSTQRLPTRSPGGSARTASFAAVDREELSRPVVEYANFSRLNRWHVIEDNPIKPRHHKGARPDLKGWTREEVQKWNQAYRDLIDKVPAEQVDELLKWYYKHHDQDYVTKARTFTDFCEKYGRIKAARKRHLRDMQRNNGHDEGQDDSWKSPDVSNKIIVIKPKKDKR